MNFAKSLFVLGVFSSASLSSRVLAAYQKSASVSFLSLFTPFIFFDDVLTPRKPQLPWRRKQELNLRPSWRSYFEFSWHCSPPTPVCWSTGIKTLRVHKVRSELAEWFTVSELSVEWECKSFAGGKVTENECSQPTYSSVKWSIKGQTHPTTLYLLQEAGQLTFSDSLS